MRRFLCVAGMTYFVCACGSIQTSPSSLAVTSSSHPVKVVVDVPEEMLLRHTTDVTLFVKYADGDVLGSLDFSRQDLVNGLTSKPFAIRNDAAMSYCKGRWIVGEQPIGLPPPDKVELLMPKQFMNDQPQFDCEWNANRNVILLRLPFVFEKVSVALSKQTFNAKAARAFIGKLSFAGAQKNFGFTAVGNQLPKTWVVNVLAPKPRQLDIGLVWIKVDASKLEQNFSTQSADIVIQ